MTARTARVLARTSLAVSTALTLVGGFFLVLGWGTAAPATQFGPKGFTIAFAAVFAVVGFVIASRRPSNPIGWIFSGTALIAGVQAVASEYARWALLAQGGRPPAGVYAAWLEEWVWIPLVSTLGVTAAIFPEGRFLSRRWRTAIVAAAVAAAIPAIVNALVPNLTIYRGYRNPLGVGGDPMQELADASVGLLMPLVILGAVAAVVRFRRSRGEERQQLKWLALSASMVALALCIFGAVAMTGRGEGNPQGLDWAENLMIASFLGIPVSIALGVLKYRLYDIDIVINRAVVYGVLAVAITIVYAAIVVGVGAAIGSRGDAVLSAVAAAIVALAFQPFRRRAQHLANRLVYGERSTPYEVLSGFSDRVAETYSVEDVIPRMARLLGQAVGAERVTVWLRTGPRFSPSGSWPASATASPLEELPPSAFEVRHQGEVLGAITVDMPPNEPLAGGSEKLVRDLASQAGLVLRNAGLVADLRASRQRLVAAQDEERRRIERNIHDGAQQQLVALAVKLRLAEQLVERDPGKARELLTQLRSQTDETLEDLRDLARGIYPPLLADEGLAAALQAQARKVPVPVEVNPDGVGRYDQEVEAAVYFCALEALQNVTKYARASTIRIELEDDGASLTFRVSDDGVGFDPSWSTRGTGLQGMADRVDALGGSLQVISAPGEGTTVLGRIPVR